MQNIIFKSLLILFGSLLTISCTKNNDVAPVNQEIVTFDSTLITGELEVKVFFLNNGTISDAPEDTYVRLYATYEDLQNGLDIYDLYTVKNRAYFGFINYNNYYVTAEATIGSVTYYTENAVQVRPNRLETLNLTMLR